MDSNFLELAYEDCYYPDCQSASNYIKRLGGHGIAKLGIIELSQHSEVVWYALDEDAPHIFPAFKDYDVENYHTPLPQYTIYPIEEDRFFYRNWDLYYFSKDRVIYKVTIYWSEYFAFFLSQHIGFTVKDCRLVKLYDPEDNSFVTTAWSVKDASGISLLIPTFADDAEIFEDDEGNEISIYDFLSRPVKLGEFFSHDDQIWSLKKNKAGFFIERAPFSISSDVS